MRALHRLMHNADRRLTGTYQRRDLTLLTLVLVLDYADRTSVGALGPTLKQAFGISNVQLGLLAAAFSFVGAGATIPLGILTDRVHRTFLLALSLMLWCVALGFVGAAVSFGMLFGARLFLGVVAATSGPTTPSLIGDLVPASQRGEVLGFINSGQLIGVGIGFVLPVVITAFFSWRWTFWLLAIAGVALAVAFWRLGEPARTTRPHRTIRGGVAMQASRVTARSRSSRSGTSRRARARCSRNLPPRCRWQTPPATSCACGPT